MPIKEGFQKQKARIFYELLYSPEAKQRGLYNYKLIDSLILTHKNKKANHSRILWLLINLELWFKIFIDKNTEFNHFR